MTARETVEGGLAEPAGLEPEPGTLALTLDVRAFLNLRDSGGELALANADALADLEGGVTSLWLELPALMDVDALDHALAGVMLDLAPVVLLASDVDATRSALELEKLLDRR